MSALGEVIRCDLYRYYGRADFGTFLGTYVRTPGFKFTFWLRVATSLRPRSGLFARGAYVASRLMLARYSVAYGYQIADITQIGPGLHLGHFGPIVVNPGVKIGRNVNIAVGVTIGQTNRGRRAGVPTLGDRVWIGPNAVLVGRITVGDGVLIAPGAYVNFDVPPGSVVVGNPGRVVSEIGTVDYIDKTLELS